MDKGFIFMDGHECHLKKEWKEQQATLDTVLFMKDALKLIGAGVVIYPGMGLDVGRFFIG